MPPPCFARPLCPTPPLLSPSTHPSPIRSSPPPPRHPYPWPLIEPLAELQNQLRRHILRDCILPPHDVGPNLLEACFWHCHLQRKIVPTPIPPPPWMPPGDSLHNTVLKATQGPLHPGGQDPHLCPKH